MKLTYWLAIGAAVLALGLWGRCASERASTAERKLNEHFAVDSVERKAWHRERLGLETQNTALRADSTVLALRFHNASRNALAARRTLDSLLASAPDTFAQGVRVVLQADSVELSSCRAIAANCELRAANAEARVAGDSARLVATEALLADTRTQWQKSLHPGPFAGLWRSRGTTLPLLAVITYLIIRR